MRRRCCCSTCRDYAGARRLPGASILVIVRRRRAAGPGAGEPQAAAPPGGARDQPLVLAGAPGRRRRWRARRWSARLLYWITPFEPAHGARRWRLIAGVGRHARRVRDEGAEARRRRAQLGRRGRRSPARCGLLDRVAPLCFAAPVFFHSVRWYLQGPSGAVHAASSASTPACGPPASASSMCDGAAPALRRQRHDPAPTRRRSATCRRA